jgi:cytochrome b
MTRPIKHIIYLTAIGGLVLVWHLAWIIINFSSARNDVDRNFPSPRAVWQTCANVTGFLDTSSTWCDHHFPLYFVLVYCVLFPLIILVVTGTFLGKERAFYREHPVGFVALTLAALSPVICVALLLHFNFRYCL